MERSIGGLRRSLLRPFLAEGLNPNPCASCVLRFELLDFLLAQTLAFALFPKALLAFLVGLRSRRRIVANEPCLLAKIPDVAGNPVNQDRHLKDSTHEDVHDRHAVHHDLLGAVHGVALVQSGLGHVFAHELMLGVEHRGAHDEDQHPNDDLAVRRRRSSEIRGERGSENRGLFEVRRKLFGDRAQCVAAPAGDSGERRDNPVKSEKNGHLDEHRQTRGKRRGSMLAINRLHLLLHPAPGNHVLLALVLLLDFLDFGLDDLGLARGSNLFVVKGKNQKANDDGQTDDRQDPRRAGAVRKAERHEDSTQDLHDPGDHPHEWKKDCIHATSFVFGGYPLLLSSLRGRADLAAAAIAR